MLSAAEDAACNISWVTVKALIPALANITRFLEGWYSPGEPLFKYSVEDQAYSSGFILGLSRIAFDTSFNHGG
jgi:hypothetical protein